jgi:hypothetical protein
MLIVANVSWRKNHNETSRITGMTITEDHPKVS